MYSVSRDSLDYFITDSTGKPFKFGSVTKYDQSIIRSIVVLLNVAVRPNLEEREDGLYVCFGDHSRSEGCKYQQISLYSNDASNFVHDMNYKFDPAKLTVSSTGGLVTYQLPVTPAVPGTIPSTLNFPLTNQSPTHISPEVDIDFWRKEMNKIPYTFEKIDTTISPLTGWICPKCGAGVSPFKGTCDCNKLNSIAQ